MRYSPERKEAVLRKMMPPHNRSIRELAREEGISESTLFNWRRQARDKGLLLADGDSGPEGWSARDKFAAVIETAGFNEADLAEYCRKKGIFHEQLLRWRQACESANDWDREQNRRLRLEKKTDRQRIKALERELNRKEKALAEAAALLVLQKKAQAIWGGPRGRMISIPDRRKTLELIDMARKAGAWLIPACGVLKISARTYQRWKKAGKACRDRRPEAIRPVPANKLTLQERKCVLDICHRKEYASLPPGQIVPRLADQGQYIASESSFYRILHAAGEQHHRGRSRKPRKSIPPKGFCARGPNQVWTWDITWLPSCIRGMFFYLYMIVDVFSRKIVGWEVYERECSKNAAAFVYKAVLTEGCVLEPPVLHSDNGSPQKGFTLSAKLQSLGIRASFSRPRVSNDNPFSEALFRKCKYRPDYPKTGFETIETARSWVSRFVYWYNEIHRHSALCFVTPGQRHRGEDRWMLDNRKRVYERAKSRNSNRWSGATRSWDYIDHVWLNGPKGKSKKAVCIAA